MLKSKKYILIIFLIFLVLTVSIIISSHKIKEVFTKKENENAQQEISFKIYSNDRSTLYILVNAKDTEYGIKNIKYQTDDGKEIKINGNGKRGISIDYKVKKDGKYKFTLINNNDEIIEKTLEVNDELRNSYTNLNNTNVKSFAADSWSGSNVPANAINGIKKDGNGYNWYGGTKLLIEYNNISTIQNIGVYTTNNWGYSFDKATIYYSEDDSLTLESELTQFKSITVKTEGLQSLSENIKAKRIILTKNEGEAVYEFECFGSGYENNGYKILNYPIVTPKGIMNVQLTNTVTTAYAYIAGVDCLATDALDKAAYDGDETTFVDVSSGKTKFYFGDNIDIYQICYKIDNSYTGIILSALTNSGYIHVRECNLLENGYYHTTVYGKGTEFWQGIFSRISVKLYEMYYDGNIT